MRRGAGVFNSDRVSMDSDDFQEELATHVPVKEELASPVPAVSPERSALGPERSTRTEVPRKGMPTAFRWLARHGKSVKLETTVVKSDKASGDDKSEDAF